MNAYDPTVQFPGNLQSYNRYSYVLNNPLSFTDPSGLGIFSKIKKGLNDFGGILNDQFHNVRDFFNDNIRTIAAIAAASIPGLNIYVAGFAAGFIASGGDVRAGIIGALTAGAFNIVGHSQSFFFQSARGILGPNARAGIVLHGLVGGASSKLSGGSFQSGFLSGGFAKASAGVNVGNGLVANVARSSIAGGIGAELGGGKFANGAQMGAFSYLFNDAAERFVQSVTGMAPSELPRTQQAADAPRALLPDERPLAALGQAWLDFFGFVGIPPSVRVIDRAAVAAAENPTFLRQACLFMSLCSPDPALVTRGNISRGPADDMVRDLIRNEDIARDIEIERTLRLNRTTRDR